MFEGLSISHLLVIAVVVMVLFGRGKVSALMGEVGKGITAFKRGVSDGAKDVDVAAPPPTQARDVTPEAEKAKV
jgi:sec-independent protein translocase protein TatA